MDIIKKLFSRKKPDGHLSYLPIRFRTKYHDDIIAYAWNNVQKWVDSGFSGYNARWIVTVPYYNGCVYVSLEWSDQGDVYIATIYEDWEFRISVIRPTGKESIIVNLDKTHTRYVKKWFRDQYWLHGGKTE